MAKYIFINTILFGCLHFVFAQKSKYDTVFVTQAVENAHSIYRQGMTEHLALYNGSDHNIYHSIGGEHPYFASDDWLKGSVILNESRYDNVELRYNAWTDKLILDNYGGRYAIQLISNEIKGFRIGDYVFESLNNDLVQHGFYELLLNGTIKVYARRTKTIQTKISNSRVNRFFIEKSKYYVFRNGEYFLVKGKKSIIQLFSSRKKEINQFVRQNDISFSRDRGRAIVMITKFLQ